MEIFDIGACHCHVFRRRERHLGRKLLGLQRAKPGRFPIILPVEALRLNPLSIGILGIHRDHATLQIDQNGQIVEIVGIHVLIHDLDDGIVFDTGAIPEGLLIEHAVETEGLHVAIAFEQVAIDLVCDSLRLGLKSRADRSLDRAAGVVGNQPDNHHREEPEQDEERRQFRGDPTVAERMFD